MLWVFLSLLCFLVHVEHDFWRTEIGVLLVAKNAKEISCVFEWVVELLSLTFKDHNFERLPVAFEYKFVHQITPTVVNVEFAQLIF